MRPTPTTDWVAEDDLATELNIPRDVLQTAREKMPPADVDRDGPWIVWKKSAAAALAQSLGLEWPPAQKNAPAGETLTVASAPRNGGFHFPNPHIIRARRATGEVVDVEVKDSSKYTTHLRTGEPMAFQAQRSTAGNYWLLIGREPRYKGGW